MLRIVVNEEEACSRPGPRPVPSRPGRTTPHGLGYVHALPGRLRLKVDGAKRDPARCHEIEALFRRMEGVSSVKVNVTTGNALIIHDHPGPVVNEFVDVLRSAGFLNGPKPVPAPIAGSALIFPADRSPRSNGATAAATGAPRAFLSQRTTEAFMACAIEVLLKVVIAGLG